jgi:N-acyl-D-aspartate/D-glutamate deacylase
VTPGFVDIHTHYDGQATWDETFSPSIHHGVTTVVMGNCGVGFAPVRKGREGELIKLMEGVEDIPGAALAEGIRWGWESFPQFMDALDAMPHSLDFLVQVPHDPVRMAVMGERAFSQARRAPTTSRRCARWCARRSRPAQPASAPAAATTTAPRRARRPARPRRPRRARGIASAFEGLGHGVIQMVSDFDLLKGPSASTPSSTWSSSSPAPPAGRSR